MSAQRSKTWMDVREGRTNGWAVLEVLQVRSKERPPPVNASPRANDGRQKRRKRVR